MKLKEEQGYSIIPPMLARILYTLRQTPRHRRELARICRERPRRGTLEISPWILWSAGVRVLVLDFDGVLASHGEVQPLPAVEVWLERCVEIFGSEAVFILSNKPTLERKAYFARRYPGLRFVEGVRKKPYPDGLLEIQKLSGAAAGTLSLLDDRLLTGALAACIAGTRFHYVGRAYVNPMKRPLKELFFMSLRLLERMLLNLMA